MPYGVWKNFDLEIVLDINPGTDLGRSFPGFSGTYARDDKEVNIFIFLSLTHGTFEVWKLYDVPMSGGPGPDYNLILYSGSFRLLRQRARRLRLRLDQRTQERTGLTEIVLERIG